MGARKEKGDLEEGTRPGKGGKSHSAAYSYIKNDSALPERRAERLGHKQETQFVGGGLFPKKEGEQGRRKFKKIGGWDRSTEGATNPNALGTCSEYPKWIPATAGALTAPGRERES